MKKIVIFDFDRSISNFHCHSVLQAKNIASNIKGNGVVKRLEDGSFLNIFINECVSDTNMLKIKSAALVSLFNNQQMGFFKHGEQLRAIIQETINNGDYFVIASFTLYPEVIVQAIEQLAPEYKDKILILGGFPSHGKPDNSPNGKYEHIFYAMMHYNVINLSDVLLADDTQNNLDRALDMGLLPENLVKIPPTPNPTDISYFDKVRAFINAKPINEVPVTPPPSSSVVALEPMEKDNTPQQPVIEPFVQSFKMKKRSLALSAPGAEEIKPRLKPLAVSS